MLGCGETSGDDFILVMSRLCQEIREGGAGRWPPRERHP
jgi:hypothetical protein